MAHSRNRTTLAVLRSHLGSFGGEPELASIIGRSASWVNKVSAGRIHMTRDIALRISMETGVCPEWLLQNNPATSPVAAESRLPFNNAFFSKYRENLRTTKPTMVDPLLEISSEALPAFVYRVARHFQAARSSPDEVKRLSDWLKNAARFLEHEFPVGERCNSAELDRTALELCRITARAWAPRRKGYKRAVGKTPTPSTSLEDIEHHEEGKSAQFVPVRRGKLRG
jgi:hypothetical protein